MAIEVTHTVTGLSGLTGGDLLPPEILAGFDYDVTPNGEGNGGLVLPYGIDLGPFAMKRVVVVRHDGVPVHSWIVDAHREHPISIGQEAAQTTQITGLGLAGLLSAYLHRDTLGFNRSPWSRTRTWGPFVPQYPRWTEWDFATDYGDILTDTPYWNGLPDGFPCFDVSRVGPSQGDTTSAPQGYWWYLDPKGEAGSITLSERSLCSFFVSADNHADFWVAGFQLGKIEPGADYMRGFRTTTRFDIVLDAGTHPIGAKIVNVPFGGGDPGYGEGPELVGNPTFFLGVGYIVGGDGRLQERIWETSSAGRIIAYPDNPPGMTLPEIVESIVEENWLDGILPLFTVNPTGTFPELESVTDEADRTLLELLRDQWAPAGLCDWHVPPTALEIQLWPSGERGTAKDVTYEVNDASPMVSTLRDLSIYSIDEDTDCLMVGWEGGWIRVPETGGSRMDRIRTAAKTPGAARDIGEAVLAGDPLPEQYTADIAPTGNADVPGVDFDCGDSIVIAGSRETVVGWSGRQEVGGSSGVRHSVIVKNRIRNEEERLEDVVRRSAPGQQRADAPTSPASVPAPLGTSIRAGEIIFQYDRGAPALSPVKRPSANGNLFVLAVTATPLGSTDSEFELLVDGFDALLGAGILPAGEEFLLLPITEPFPWMIGNTTALQGNVPILGADIETLLLEPRFL